MASTTRLQPPELEAWQALLHAHAQLTDVLDQELRAEHEITLGEYDVLLRLARAPRRRLRMTDLATRALMPPSSLSRVIDRLVQREMVVRERDDTDNRVVYACLTNAGRSRVRKAALTHLRGIREHFSSRLSDAQLRAVAGGLKRISGVHEPH